MSVTAALLPILLVLALVQVWLTWVLNRKHDRLWKKMKEDEEAAVQFVTGTKTIIFIDKDGNQTRYGSRCN